MITLDVTSDQAAGLVGLMQKEIACSRLNIVYVSSAIAERGLDEETAIRVYGPLISKLKNGCDRLDITEEQAGLLHKVLDRIVSVSKSIANAGVRNLPTFKEGDIKEHDAIVRLYEPLLENLTNHYAYALS